MRADEVVDQPKKSYVKPVLVTHGSVQELTEGGHRRHNDDRPHSGSDIRIVGWDLKDW